MGLLILKIVFCIFFFCVGFFVRDYGINIQGKHPKLFNALFDIVMLGLGIAGWFIHSCLCKKVAPPIPPGMFLVQIPFCFALGLRAFTRFFTNVFLLLENSDVRLIISMTFGLTSLFIGIMIIINSSRKAEEERDRKLPRVCGTSIGRNMTTTSADPWNNSYVILVPIDTSGDKRPDIYANIIRYNDIFMSYDNHSARVYKVCVKKVGAYAWEIEESDIP